ncbi:unnamed protein product [Ostreobium quekettii]|uniref:Alpha/Beta hydrolase protein n=1 Tax=Ostreobium quekettii TaxID=121088 RepID=A0A8S1J0T1_9CHLO|nr:unnamed protein product [Ostreobium quekettii]|eukprot:evm.model.scf_894.3 EVM.evm.TU.scf_894.3   scf_894:41761-50674(-)
MALRAAGNCQLAVLKRTSPEKGVCSVGSHRGTTQGHPRPPVQSRWVHCGAATNSGDWSDTFNGSDDRQGSFTGVERVIQDVFYNNQPPGRSDWEEIENCWVLRPPPGTEPVAVVHFVGGAFVGAAPQLAYRQLLESLAERKVLVVATPFSTTFDHLRAADEAQFKFDSAMTAIGEYAEELPVYGAGHSLGALIHLLISSRYALERAGNVLMSFNNRPATEVVPLLAQLGPSSTLLGPVLSQLASSPLRPTAEMLQGMLKGISPSLIRQIIPLAEQLAPIYMDVTQGRQEFSPSPEETRNRIRSFYGVRRNLLLQFTDDQMDESDELASMIQASGIGGILDMTIRTLPGDHARPMQQAMVDLPPSVAQAANQACETGGDIIGQLSKMAADAGQAEGSDQLDQLSKSVSSMASFFGGDAGGPAASSIAALADEIAGWMGAGLAPRALPAGRASAQPSTPT